MADIKRGVSLYSLQDQYARKKMTLDEIIYFVKNNMSGTGIEIIPDQMLPGSPCPSAETLAEWDRIIEKHQIVPVCSGIYVNDKLYKNRLLTVREAAANLEKGIHLAHRLGCSMIKLVSTTRTEVVEAVLPEAEKCKITITSEIHGGMSFNMPYVQDYVRMMERLQSPYLGFTIDTGIFCRRHPRVSTRYFRLLGMSNPYLESYIEDLFAQGTDPNAYFIAHPEKMGEMMEKCTTELERLYLVYSTGYDNNPLTILDDYMPYVKYIHGKFWEMTEEGKEYSIPYDEVISYLKEKGFDGYINTEYEGNRFTPPGEMIQEIEQVSRHQKMLKQLIEG